LWHEAIDLNLQHCMGELIQPLEVLAQANVELGHDDNSTDYWAQHLKLVITDPNAKDRYFKISPAEKGRLPVKFKLNNSKYHILETTINFDDQEVRFTVEETPSLFKKSGIFRAEYVLYNSKDSVGDLSQWHHATTLKIPIKLYLDRVKELHPVPSKV